MLDRDSYLLRCWICKKYQSDTDTTPSLLFEWNTTQNYHVIPSPKCHKSNNITSQTQRWSFSSYLPSTLPAFRSCPPRWIPSRWGTTLRWSTSVSLTALKKSRTSARNPVTVTYTASRTAWEMLLLNGPHAKTSALHRFIDFSPTHHARTTNVLVRWCIVPAPPPTRDGNYLTMIVNRDWERGREIRKGIAGYSNVEQIRLSLDLCRLVYDRHATFPILAIIGFHPVIWDILKPKFVEYIPSLIIVQRSFPVGSIPTLRRCGTSIFHSAVWNPTSLFA